MPADYSNTQLPEEHELWEKILQRKGLGMDAGLDNHWLTYGWLYHSRPDDKGHEREQEPFDYDLRHKPADTRGGARLRSGKKALCVRHLSSRCSCSHCVNNSHESNTPTNSKGAGNE